MTGIESLPPKRTVAEALLERGSVYVHLDPRHTDVVVPDWLTDRPQLVLQVGLDMPVPIPDLRIDDVGVFATLSFRRLPFTCEVPWDAVFALVGEDGQGMVWPEQLPDEIAAEVERAARRRSTPVPAGVRALDPSRMTDESTASPRGPGEARGEPPALRVLDGGGEKRDDPARSTEARPRPPWLRRVK